MIEKLASVTGWLQSLRSTGKQHLEEAAPYVDKAVAWGLEQGSRLGSQIPDADDVEAWLHKNAARFGWSEKPRSDSLEHLEQVLTQTIAAIRQQSERHTRMLVSTVLGKTAGVAAVAGIGGWITAFGAAANGAAIAALHGAAATSAKLYWIGSVVGLGVAAGGVMLAGAGIGIGAAAGIWGRQRMIGKPRIDDSLQDHERAILCASHSLIAAVRAQIAGGGQPAPGDMRLFAEHGLIPLANQINQYWDEPSLRQYGKLECQPFTRTLAFLHRRRLNQCRTELGRIAMNAMAAGHKH